MTDVVMPQMGESIVEGTLTKWLKKPGDRVERDEPLFEISTDKVDTEIPSPAAGTLGEVLVQEGTTVGINTVVARIGDEAVERPQRRKPRPCRSSAAPPKPQARRAAPARHRRRLQHRAPAAPQPAAAAHLRRDADVGEAAGPLSPLVRKMAREIQYRSERR